MGLVVCCWYDYVCFAVVAVAVVASLYELCNREGKGCRHEDKHNENENENALIPRGRGRASKSYVSSSQLWETCWRSLHPASLLALRLISFLLLIAFLSWDLARWGPDIFIYYTEWSFSLVIMYFGIASVISAHGCWLHYYSNITSPNQDTEANQVSHQGFTTYEDDTAGFWGYFMQTAYQACAGATILTDVVFWCIIVPLLSNSRLGLNLLMGCMHTLNLVLLLLDTSINRLSFPWFRLAYFVLWSSVYVVFQWLIHLFGFSWWPYPFLELSTPVAPVWYLILAVIHVACYGLYAGIVRVKDSVLSRLFPHSYVTSC